MTTPEDSTNIPLVRVGRSGRVKVASEDGRKDADSAAFKRLMAKMQEESLPGGYLHGRGALDHDDVLYLKEQRAAELDAERMRDHNERKAFMAFRMAAMKADTHIPLPVSVEPKLKSGIRQQSLLKNLLEVRPKRARIGEEEQKSSPKAPTVAIVKKDVPESAKPSIGNSEVAVQDSAELQGKLQTSGSLLFGLSYAESDDEDSAEDDRNGGRADRHTE